MCQVVGKQSKQRKARRGRALTAARLPVPKEKQAQPGENRWICTRRPGDSPRSIETFQPLGQQTLERKQ